jgi:hypothetical protein
MRRPEQGKRTTAHQRNGRSFPLFDWGLPHDPVTSDLARPCLRCGPVRRVARWSPSPAVGKAECCLRAGGRKAIVFGSRCANALVIVYAVRSPVRVFPQAVFAHRGRRAEQCPVGNGAEGEHEAGELDRRQRLAEDHPAQECAGDRRGEAEEGGAAAGRRRMPSNHRRKARRCRSGSGRRSRRRWRRSVRAAGPRRPRPAGRAARRRAGAATRWPPAGGPVPGQGGAG